MIEKETLLQCTNNFTSNVFSNEFILFNNIIKIVHLLHYISFIMILNLPNIEPSIIFFFKKDIYLSYIKYMIYMKHIDKNMKFSINV